MSYKGIGIRTKFKICRICKKKFNPYTRFNLYCSRNCYAVYYRKINRQKDKLRRVTKRKLIYSHYGSKCACCGEEEFKFLTIDHVNNDGYKEKNKSRSSESYLNSIIKRYYPDKYQILCMNCNFGKKYTGVCPHKQEVVSRVV